VEHCTDMHLVRRILGRRRGRGELEGGERVCVETQGFLSVPVVSLIEKKVAIEFNTSGCHDVSRSSFGGVGMEVKSRPNISDGCTSAHHVFAHTF